MKQKGKRPHKMNKISSSYRDVASDSDNEPIGDIYTDEISDFTAARNKVSLGNQVSDSEEEEAILPLHGDDDDDDSDEELGEWSKRLKHIKFQNKLAKSKDKGKKVDKDGSWGNKREDYYGSFAKKNLRRVAANEKDDWTMEAQEVEKLQSKLDEDIEEEDFMTPSLAPPKKSARKEKESTLVVKQDLTDKEKKALQDKLHPEAQPLREELNRCLEELELIKGKKGWRIQSKDTCFRLLAANIAFYLHLIENNEDCRGHPVLKRIVQWKKLAKMYQDISEELMEPSDDEQENEEMDDDRLAGVLDNEDSMPVEDDAKQSEEGKEEDVMATRPITYQMEKNKVSKQKAKQNNPRVKNKEKFRKAKNKRRGQVREYRPEIHKYHGESSGIRAGLTKSTPLH